MRREWLRSTKPHPPARALSARNGIFGCGDQAPEIAERDNELPHRLKRRRTDSGNPGTNGLLEPDGKIPGSAGLGGGGCSQPKPVSWGVCLLTGKNTGNLAIFAPWHTWDDQILLRFEAFAPKFPASIIREYTFKNREFSFVNNELWAAAHPPFPFPLSQTRVSPARLY